MAGKPAPALMTEAVARGDFRAALVVGDRLDTDIEGANAAGLPSLMVLTGVNSAWDAVYAEPVRRPTYIGHDLRSLHQDSKLLAVAPQPGWQIDVGGGAVTVCANGDVDDLEFIDDGLSIVRAVASAVWEARAADLHQRPLRIEAGDERARAALQRWSLMRSDHPVTSVGTQ
ncbi:phosphatase [Mycobacterium tuberculosis]|nr:phosphatase [Mycobacterium tuberculosis]CFS10986.1 phosphatase [Mycobacterium tuberculosis]